MKHEIRLGSEYKLRILCLCSFLDTTSFINMNYMSFFDPLVSNMKTLQRTSTKSLSLHNLHMQCFKWCIILRQPFHIWSWNFRCLGQVSSLHTQMSVFAIWLAQIEVRLNINLHLIWNLLLSHLWRETSLLHASLLNCHVSKHRHVHKMTLNFSCLKLCSVLISSRFKHVPPYLSVQKPVFFKDCHATEV